MALHFVYVTITDPDGNKMNTEKHIFDFQELLKPQRFASFYSKVTGVPVGQLRVNITRE